MEENIFFIFFWGGAKKMRMCQGQHYLESKREEEMFANNILIETARNIGQIRRCSTVDWSQGGEDKTEDKLATFDTQCQDCKSK